MLSVEWLWVLALLPLPWFIYRFTPPVKKQQAAIRIPFYQQLVTGSSNRPSHNNRKSGCWWLLWLIWVLLVIATARPQWLGEPIAQQASGRDLLLAVDISDSMEQADMEANNEIITRIQSVKLIVSDFIQRRQGDRIGLILFGSQAYLQAPLTFDTKTVEEFLTDAQLGFAGPKTAIGDAIGLAVKRLQQLTQRNDKQVVILLTDGANTSGEIEPLQAAQLAKKMGVTIYTIGIGAEEMVIRGFFGPRRVNPSAQLDEKTLVTIADETDGKYFRAKNTDELNRIYQQLDILEPVEQEQQWLRPVTALFMWPLAIALLLSLWLMLWQFLKPSQGTLDD